MKSLYEQSQDLIEDAENISKQVLLGKDVAHEIAMLCYRFAELRVCLMNKRNNNNNE